MKGGHAFVDPKTGDEIEDTLLARVSSRAFFGLVSGAVVWFGGLLVGELVTGTGDWSDLIEPWELLLLGWAGACLLCVLSASAVERSASKGAGLLFGATVGLVACWPTYLEMGVAAGLLGGLTFGPFSRSSRRLHDAVARWQRRRRRKAGDLP